MVCPYCGVELPPAPVVPSPKETTEQLIRRTTTPEEAQRAFYDKLVGEARKKGHKPGYAAAKFKDHYGKWPPWAWSEATMSSFASDQEWNMALEAKQERVAKYKKSEPKELPPEELDVPDNDANEDYEPTAEMSQEEDDSFAAWTDEQGIT